MSSIKTPQANTPPATKVHWFQITDEHCGQRIDNFLHTYLKGVPRSKIYNILRKGEVRVNKRRVKPIYRLALGDEVRIPPVKIQTKTIPQAKTSIIDRIENSILFEDEELMVINKPSGIAVHGGSGISLGLIETLRQSRPQQRFMELVHRLDRDTSGCIMIAKKRKILTELHAALREKHVQKTYHALVSGRWPKRKQLVNAPLEKNVLNSGERMVRVSPTGKVSKTRFKVLEPFQQATLIEASPITGRTHQIRVHCQYAGHSIIGDDKYGDSDVNSKMKMKGIKRLCLHAYELEFKLPNSGKQLSIRAPYDDALSRALQQLSSTDSVE